MPETTEQLRERKRLEKQRQRAALRADPEKYEKALESRNRADRERRAMSKGAKPEAKPKGAEPDETVGAEQEFMEFELMTTHKAFPAIKKIWKAQGNRGDDVDVVESLEWLTDYIVVSETIDNMPVADSTKNTYYANINSFLRLFYPDASSAISHYQQQMKSTQKKITSVKGENCPTEAEEESHVFWDDVLARKDKIEDSEDAIIYGFYTDKAPRRLQDLFLLKVWTKSAGGLKRASKDFNYVRIEDGEANGGGAQVAEIILKNYKTYNKYGEYDMKPSEEYKEKIIQYIEERGLKHGDLLFPKYQESPKQTQIVKTVFDRIVGKPMTVCDLRKSMVSYYWDELNLNQKKELAKLMATSVGVMEEWYLKLPFKKKNKTVGAKQSGAHKS
jgi:hypothetical protein